MVYIGNVDVDELLMEIRELSEIPAFAGAIKHKVNELKLSLSENIELHRDIENMVYDDNGDKKIFKEQEQQFELTRIGRELWIPSIPGKHRNTDIYAIIPREIIKYIVNKKSKKGITVMKRGLSLRSLKGRTFDLCFEKKTGKFITGVISEKGGPRIEKKVRYPGIRYDPQKIKPEEMKMLFKYFINHPFYFKRVFENFLKVWKKALDKSRSVDGRF